jgi:ribonuclease P/MRP protein subunit RPP40
MCRLEVNDRADPYVAVYSPPNPSRTGTISHLRWRGLLSPAFVQLIVDSAMYVPPASHRVPIHFFQWYNNALSIYSFRSSLSKTTDPSSSFISITAHTFSTSPVTYIPPGAEPGGTGREAPLRVPRKAAEHCWSLILIPGSSTVGDEGKVMMQGQDNETGQGSWAMAETVGKWDMRWG